MLLLLRLLLTLLDAPLVEAVEDAESDTDISLAEENARDCDVGRVFSEDMEERGGGACGCVKVGANLVLEEYDGDDVVEMSEWSKSCSCCSCSSCCCCCCRWCCCC